MNGDDTRASSSAGASGQPGTTPWIGRVVDGRYRVLERLGEGGMGAVFVAEHIQLQKRVALKVIHAEFSGHQEIAARFAREAMTSAHIEHPNVASALDFGTLPEGGAYLVMQLARGTSLRDYLLQHKALAWPEACSIAAQIADAVTAAHASGVVHRDLKPDNVVLVPAEQGPPTVKVLDFGIAHVKAQAVAPTIIGKPLTQVGVVIGTPGYMPPEQGTGSLVDERADLYALGVMLWELLMGRSPFKGGSFAEILMEQLQKPAPELELSGDRSAPPELHTLVRTLLARTPEERPSTAASVRDTLRTLAQGAEFSNLGAPGLTLLGEHQRSTLRMARTGFLHALPKPWLYAAASVVIAATTVMWWKMTRDDGPASTPEPPSAVVEPAPRPRTRAEKAKTPESEPAQADPEAAKAAAPRETERPEPAAAKRTPKSSTRTKQSSRPAKRLKRALNDIFQ